MSYRSIKINRQRSCELFGGLNRFATVQIVAIDWRRDNKSSGSSVGSFRCSCRYFASRNRYRYSNDRFPLDSKSYSVASTKSSRPMLLYASSGDEMCFTNIEISIEI